MKKHNKKVYFKDWYLRIVDAKNEKTLCCTMRLNKIGSNIQGSLKVIYDTGEKKQEVSMPVTEVMVEAERVNFGHNVWSKEAVVFDLEKEVNSIKGRLELEQVVDLNQSFLKPGLMGVYKHLPLLEFYQEVIILKGKTLGILNINGDEIDFTDGNCYIHRQWGSKFPNIWLWGQCTGFDHSDEVSLMLGIARIKIFFNYYTAFAIPVYYNDKVEIFSNYNGGHIAKLYRYKGYVHLIITQKDKLLDLKIYGRDELECISSKESHGIRDVYECDRVKMEVKISERGNILWEGTSLGGYIEMGGNTSKLK